MNVEDLSEDDVVEFNDARLVGQWRVSDTVEQDVGITMIPIATIVRDGTGRVIVGNCTHPDGKTIQVRTTDDERLFHIDPDGIKVVAKR